MDVFRHIKKTVKKPVTTLFSKVYGVPKTHIQNIADFVFGEAVEGDYLEFGVFRGEQFVAGYQALETAEREWSSEERNLLAYSKKERAKTDAPKQRGPFRYFAFDSFDGLPELKGVDKESARFSKGRYDCSEKEFLSNLSAAGVNTARVTTVSGWYNESLNDATKKRLELKAAAVVLIDCDLYESTKDVLNFITDIVVDGTVVIFDDWYSFKAHPNRGEQRATREWLEKNPKLHLTEFPGGVGQKTFIVNLL